MGTAQVPGGAGREGASVPPSATGDAAGTARDQDGTHDAGSVREQAFAVGNDVQSAASAATSDNVVAEPLTERPRGAIEQTAMTGSTVAEAIGGSGSAEAEVPQMPGPVAAPSAVAPTAETVRNPAARPADLGVVLPEEPAPPAAQEGRGRLRLLTLDGLIAASVAAPERPVLGRWMHEGQVAGLIGPPGVGKSQVVTQTAVCIAGGKPFADEAPAQPATSVILNLEDGPGVMQRRIRAAISAVGADPALVQSNLRIVDAPEFKAAFRTGRGQMAGTAELRELFDQVAQLGAKAVFFDPWAEIHGGCESDNDEMLAVARLLRSHARERGCAVVIAHHFGKEGKLTLNSARGASSVTGILRTALAVTGPTDDDVRRFGLAADDVSHLCIRELKLSYHELRAESVCYKRQLVLVDGEAAPRLVRVQPGVPSETRRRR